MLSVSAVSAAIAPWLADKVELELGEWKVVVGESPGKTFVLKCLGVGIANCRTLDKIFASLRLEDGSYQKFTATAVDKSSVEKLETKLTNGLKLVDQSSKKADNLENDFKGLRNALNELKRHPKLKS